MPKDHVFIDYWVLQYTKNGVEPNIGIIHACAKLPPPIRACPKPPPLDGTGGHLP